MTNVQAKLLEDAQAQLAAVFQRGVPIYIAFSGGKESALLLSLCEPYAGKFKLLWINTGYQFPHVETYIRELGERFGIVEMKSDLASRWRDYGLPTELLPVRNAFDNGCHDEPKLQAWISCCIALRGQPALDFAEAQTSPAIVIHGQRKEDRAPGNGYEAITAGLVTALAPLADWSTEDVLACIEGCGIMLPKHYYAGIVNSLDCWCCPKNLTRPYGPALIDFMAEEYPEQLRTLMIGAERIFEATSATNALLAATIGRAEHHALATRKGG